MGNVDVETCRQWEIHRHGNMQKWKRKDIGNTHRNMQTWKLKHIDRETNRYGNTKAWKDTDTGNVKIWERCRHRKM